MAANVGRARRQVREIVAHALKARGGSPDQDSFALDLLAAAGVLGRIPDAANRRRHLRKLWENARDPNRGFLVGEQDRWQARLAEAEARYDALRDVYGDVEAALRRVAGEREQTDGAWSTAELALLLERGGWIERLLEARRVSENNPSLTLDAVLRDVMAEGRPTNSGKWGSMDRRIRDALVGLELAGDPVTLDQALRALGLSDEEFARLQLRPDLERAAETGADLHRHAMAMEQQQREVETMIRLAQEIIRNEQTRGLRPAGDSDTEIRDPDISAWRARLTEIQGERALTHHMLTHPSRTGPDASNPVYRLALGFEAGQGFDQVWVRMDGDKIVEFVVGEAKGPGATLAEGQMDAEWVGRGIQKIDPAIVLPNGVPLRDAMDTARKLGRPPVRGVVVTGQAGTAESPQPSYTWVTRPAPWQDDPNPSYFGKSSQ